MWPIVLFRQAWSSWETKPLQLYIFIEILLQKVKHVKCDPCFEEIWSSWQTKPPQLYMNRNFAQKSATWKVWPLFGKRYGPSQLSKPLQLYIDSNFAQKSETWKVWPLALERGMVCMILQIYCLGVTIINLRVGGYQKISHHQLWGFGLSKLLFQMLKLGLV